MLLAREFNMLELDQSVSAASEQLNLNILSHCTSRWQESQHGQMD